MLPNIHILGIQGSGKSTQSALLVEKYGLSYFSSGNQFRLRSKQSDILGEKISHELTLGRLLPDELLVQVIEDYLTTNQPTIGLLGDGAIRTLEQKELLKNTWSRFNLDEPFLIELRLDPDLAKKRINKRAELQADHQTDGGKLVQRTDDYPQAIEQRFALFHSMTQPVLEYFTKNKRCISLSGDQSIEDIHQQICQSLPIYYPNLNELN